MKPLSDSDLQSFDPPIEPHFNGNQSEPKPEPTRGWHLFSKIATF
jgi:hypothetical protein